MVNGEFSCFKIFWQEIKGYSHLKNGEKLILKRHFVYHVYKKEKA